MKASCQWATFVIAMVSAPVSQGVPIASDSFATTAGLLGYSVGSIGDQNPIEGCSGFSGGWNGGTAAFVATDGGLTHALTPGQTWDGRLIAYTSSSSATRNLSRLMTYTPSSGTYYMSVLLQKNAFTTTRDLMAGLGAYNHPETSIFDIYASHIGFVDGGISFFAPGAQIWQLLPYAQVNVNETYFALLQYDYSTSGPDTVTATIYNGASSQVAQQSFAGLGLDGSLTHFSVLTQEFGPMVAIDEWRFRTTLSDVMVPPLLAGDYNNNGVVDAADYVVWRDNEGTTTSLPNDNGIGGTIGQPHYDLWRAHFGQTAAGGSAGYPLGASAESLSAAVPEPAGPLLLLLGTVGSWRARRIASKMLAGRGRSTGIADWLPCSARMDYGRLL